ncbi:MAG: aspartate dehydrogenase [Candidatus Omnitrophota bacterium]
MKKIKVGIIGCGTIGSEIARACARSLSKKIIVSFISDSVVEKAVRVKRSLGGRPKVVGTRELIQKSDLVVEAASASVSGSILEQCLRKRKDVLIMSVGGLLKQTALLREAEKGTSRVYIPSGAVSGIDGIKASMVGGIRSVRLITRKPPRSLAGAEYLARKGIDIARIRKDTVVFDGTAREAVKAFPKNINVSAVVSLASLPPEKVRVMIVASPKIQRNTHELEIRSNSGVIVTRTENVPSENNPKTSKLAVLSAIATIQGIVGNVRIGT